jgi:hypothetical protein
MTEKQIQSIIKAGGDSVWVVESEIEKLNNGTAPTIEIKSAIDRNVEHLKLIVGNQEIVDSGEDISDLNNAISIGEAKLAEVEWPPPVVDED